MLNETASGNSTAAEEVERRKAETKEALQREPAKIANNPGNSIARIDTAIKARISPA